MLGLAMSYAFSSKSDLYIHKLAKRALNKIDSYHSKIIGNTIRIIREVDGPEFITPSFNLQIREKYIEITTKDILPRQVFDNICDRLKDISYCRRSIR
jgi:exopolyphosphatase/guanosine-5'-triphosphate,3'-diphosphate pyrophosphatase